MLTRKGISTPAAVLGRIAQNSGIVIGNNNHLHWLLAITTSASTREEKEAREMGGVPGP